MRTTVLCVGRNEKDLAVWKFLLETRGYRVQLAFMESYDSSGHPEPQRLRKAN